MSNKIETVRVRLDVEIDTDQPGEVRRILAARGIRDAILYEMRYKFVAVGMAAGSRAGGVALNLTLDEAGPTAVGSDHKSSV